MREEVQYKTIADMRSFTLQEAYFEVGGFGKLHVYQTQNRKVPDLCEYHSVDSVCLRVFHWPVTLIPYITAEIRMFNRPPFLQPEAYSLQASRRGWDRRVLYLKWRL
jgi:hypothetical protein